MTSVCLTMIVKDHAACIGACLDSVRPFIDSWVVVDLGSRDDTRDLVRARLDGLPGELHQRVLSDWSTVRNEALALASARADYLLLMDPSDVVVAEPGFRFPRLAEDEVWVRVSAGDLSVWRTQIVRSALPWRYHGVAYESLACDVPHSTARMAGMWMRHAFEPDAEQRRARYELDASLLQDGLRDEPLNTRYAFYLAECYRGLGECEKAVGAYEHRASMNGYEEEAWLALYQAARMRELAQHDRSAVVEAYLRAYDRRPSRAEPLCDLARYYRERGEHAVAHLFASRAIAIARPDDALFVQESVYAWKSLDEYAVSAFYVGKVAESAEVSRRLLRGGKLPVGERARVEANLALCEQRLGPSVRSEKNKKKRARRAR